VTLRTRFHCIPTSNFSTRIEMRYASYLRQVIKRFRVDDPSALQFLLIKGRLQITQVQRLKHIPISLLFTGSQLGLISQYHRRHLSQLPSRSKAAASRRAAIGNFLGTARSCDPGDP
jgi:hypothetical protein